MGIYDRDYARREGSGFFSSLGGRGTVWMWLIGITVGVFVVLVFTTPGGGHGLNALGRLLTLEPERVLHGEVWRLLTYAFVHDPHSHLLALVFGMLFLWWFGKDIEDIYGPREFLGFYL